MRHTFHCTVTLSMDKKKKIRRAASIEPNTEYRDGNFWCGKEAVFFRVLGESIKQVIPRLLVQILFVCDLN